MGTNNLRERMQQVLRVRNYSERTVETYVDAIKRFANYWKRRPDQLGAEEVRSYQIWLRDEQHVSWSFFNQTAGALRFFYTQVLERPEAIERIWYAKPERKLPVVLSVEELVQFLEAATVPRYRALLTTMYAGGLRLSETLNLRVEDIDSARMVIRVRKGKGKKDRYVPLSPIVLDLLRAHWRNEKPPQELNILALWAPRVLYDAMLRCAGQTLLDGGRSKLGVQLGALCVLHTWGQTLQLHPHIHCVVPGGGFAAGGAQWRSVTANLPSFFP